MASRNLLRPFVITLFGVLAACSAAPPEESVDGTGSNVTKAAFDKNTVIDDKSMKDTTAMSADDVQSFFDTTPWGTKSVLATYTENGQTAAQIISAAATKYELNPLALIVRVQMEQGLVSKKTAPATTIAIAFGCGCPDGAACADKYKGFANQAECAAGTLSRSMARAITTDGTVSGWARNKMKTSLDGLAVVPTNAATAALYTYTPWVGEAGGGKKGVGGASLHFQVWNQFATAISYGPTSVESSSGSTPAPKAAEAGAPDPSADPDAGTDPVIVPDPDPTATDAGAGTGPKKATPPSDGSEDGTIIGDGNAPPANNAPPPSNPATSKSADYGKDRTAASASELAGKDKTTGGCSTSGAGTDASSFGLVGLAAALSLAAARRRRR